MDLYEKKYKEVKELIEDCIPDEDGYIHVRPSDILPELAESEDEEIRKAIIKHFQEGCSSPLSVDLTSALAWLEKQGKQKVIIPKFRVGDIIKCKYDDRQFTIKSVDLDKGTYTYTQEGCGNDIDYADEEFELVEQQPAWSEEDEKYIKDLVDYFTGGLSLKHTEWDIVNWLKSLKDRILSKQEWSEEDKKIIEDAETWLDTLCDYLKDSSSECIPTVKEIISKLKYLRDRIQPQPKQEWSEEDCNQIETIACHLDNIGNGAMAESLLNIMDKYKSLRPQKHWKPSEEQLNVLKLACSHYDIYGLDANGVGVLKGLLEQLKEL